MFDWQGFLDRQGIEYQKAQQHELLVRCPFCPDDELTNRKAHMSINTMGKGWKCWRDRGHRGRRPHKLIEALTGYSWEHIERITGGSPVSSPGNLLEQARNSLNPRPVLVSRQLILPEEFHPITRTLLSCAPFRHYLRSRGFTDIDRLQKRYDLHFCIRGQFKGRIIIPIKYQDRLVSWVGRAISPQAELRYLTLGAEEAAGPITDYLLWYDQLVRSDIMHTICLCEGPFDAFKLNEFGLQYGLCATCFFTSSPSPRQVSLLYELLPRFRRKILLLDQNTLAMSLRLALELSSLGVERGQLPGGVKDPGELNGLQIKDLALKTKVA